MGKTIVKVASLIVDKNNPKKILLIKEKTEKNKIAKWNVVKGTCEIEKETVLQTVGRECLEEISVKVEIKKFIGCYLIFKKINDIRLQFNFIVNIKAGTPHVQNKKTQTKFKESITNVCWFSQEEIKKMKENEFVSKFIKELLSDWTNNKFLIVKIFK